MVTIKENIEKLNLDIDLPEIQHTYRVFAPQGYETYEYKTINGQKCIELKGFGNSNLLLKCAINIETKKITEYVIWGEDDCRIVSSIDKDGDVPFY